MRSNAALARTPGGMAGSYASNMRAQTTGSGINAAPTNHGRYSSRHLPYVLLDFDKVQVFVDAVSGTPENPYWAGDNTSYKFDVSRITELSVQLYLRNPNARQGAGRSEDIFLGVIRVNPRFEEPRQYVEDPKASKKDREKGALAFAQEQRELGLSGTEWLDVSLGTGSIKIGVSFVENRQRALKIEDFELLKVVGKGSFGKVMQVRSVTSHPWIYRSSMSQANFGYPGNAIPIVSMLSKLFERLISSLDLKLLIRWLKDLCLHRSTTRSSSP